MGNSSSTNINSDSDTSSNLKEFDNNLTPPQDLIIPSQSHSVSPPASPENTTKRILSPDPKLESCSRLEHGDSPKDGQPPLKRQKKNVEAPEPDPSDIADSDWTSPTSDGCIDTTKSATIRVPYDGDATPAQDPLSESSYAPEDNANPSATFMKQPEDEARANTNPLQVLDILSRYDGTEPVHAFTSIRPEHLSGNHILAQGRATDAATISYIIGRGADRIIELLEHHQTSKENKAYAANSRFVGRHNELAPELTRPDLCNAKENIDPNFEPTSSPEVHQSLSPQKAAISESSMKCVPSGKNNEDIKEVGVERDANQEPMRDLIKLLEGRISKLHQEKEALRKAASKYAQDLEKSTFYIQTMRRKYTEQIQRYEVQTTASLRARLKEHVDILNKRQKRIIEDARINQTNRDMLVRVKDRLKDEMNKLVNEKRKLGGKFQRCDAESRRLEEEVKENEEIRAKLRVKERNECWMFKKLQLREKTFEDFQVEKEMWEKEREELGNEIRRLKAELATSM